MAKHFQREIDLLKKKILILGTMVEERFRDAVYAIDKRDAAFAHQVIDKDIEVDEMEVEIEEDCLKVLALHQPVAIDLRFIIAVLKINNDLERIGDLSVNIAERAAYLAGKPKVNVEFNFDDMARKTQRMLKNSLDALVNMSSKLAYEVCTADDEIDAINREGFQKAQEGIRQFPDQLKSLIHLLSACRHVERIADHATNIAEDVIYMIEGAIIRHKTEDFQAE